jgi:hypothetical protein
MSNHEHLFVQSGQYAVPGYSPGTDMPTLAFMNEKINSGSIGGKIMPPTACGKYYVGVVTQH